MSMIYLDIETLPTADLEAIREIAETIAPPGNISKAETIAAWEAEKKLALVAQAVAKTSFDTLLGSIACVCWAVDDAPVQAVDCRGGESEMLADLFDQLRGSLVSAHSRIEVATHTYVGHNLAGFDLPYIKHRAIVHGIKPPVSLMRAMNAKPWDSAIADTMLMWSSDRDRRVGLDKLCRAMGIKGKDGFDGSMVAQTWPVDPERVIAYCKNDVERVRALHARLTFREAT
jgi:predicted PolB exonuclease-like 3'-5' exonuclease